MARARDAFVIGDAMGSLPASYSLAHLLADTGEDAGNNARAFGLMKKTADAGYPLGQLWLGLWLREGTVGPARPDLARPFLRDAADNGNARVAYELAVMYRDGVGGAVDAAKSLAFLKQAAKGGHAAAREELGLD